MAGKRTSGTPTQRTMAEGEAAALWNSVLEHAPVMAMALDARGRVVAWNRECRRVTGYRLDHIRGAGWTKLFGDAATRRAMSQQRRDRLDQPFSGWVWPITTAKGKRHQIAWTSASGRSPFGPHSRWAIGQDVTDLLEAREASARAEEYLRYSQQTVGFGAWTLDPAAGTVTCTPELEAIYHVPRGTFGQRYTDFSDRVHPEDLKVFERIRELAVAAGKPFEYEYRIRRPDGQVRWINTKGRGVRGPDGKLQKVVGVDTDVTDRKQTEARLHQTDEDLRMILQSPAIVLFHQDREHRYTWISNPTLGATLAESIGRTDDELLGKAAARPLTEIKRRVIRTGRGERQEVRISRGSLAGWYDLMLEPKRNAGGRVVGVAGTAIDITARKQAEEALALAHRRGQELAAHLRDTVEQERTAISRDVHDQVGAILTAIRLRLASLANRIPTTSVTERAEILSIEALTESAMHATRDICSRLRPPSLEDIGLADTCRWYLAEWSRNSGIKAVGRIPRSPCHGDPLVSTDLFRILQELLTNVARHSGASQVHVTLTCGRRQMRLHVRDDGRGLRPEQMSRGFGLPGIRERAQHHRGRVDIISNSQGTSVDVIIPLKVVS